MAGPGDLDLAPARPPRLPQALTDVSGYLPTFLAEALRALTSPIVRIEETPDDHETLNKALA